jgi:uncharacterized protein (TIGR03435 family)
MSEPDDHELLAQYAQGPRENSEAAFAALAERHVNLVYSTALRSVGNSHAAEEVSQAVFIVLANKAGKLANKASKFSRRVVLSGWLYQTTRLTAANFLRGEIRRQQREQEAFMQSTLQEPADDLAWRQIAPLLDEALGKLGDRDRNAILLRFFEGKSLAEVGAAAGTSEDAAKMRVNRALEKLRKIFDRRGAPFSVAAIAGAVSANSVHAAPVGLAKTISAVALFKGAAAGGSTLTLAKGILKIMAWSKMQTGIVVGAVVLLTAGTTTVAVKEIQEHRTYPWQIPGYDSRVLDQQPPQVRILSSKIKFGSWGSNGDKYGNMKFMGTGVSAETILLAAYHFDSLTRTVGSGLLPEGKYDYIACLPKGNEEALKKEIKRKFGVTARIETQERDVLLLKVKTPNAPDLKPSNPNSQFGSATRDDGPGAWSCENSPISSLTAYLEDYLRIPIVDQTGLANHFDITLKWKQSNWGENNPDELKNAVLDQAGFALVPGREPVEMLVVEKADN